VFEKQQIAIFCGNIIMSQ